MDRAHSTLFCGLSQPRYLFLETLNIVKKLPKNGHFFGRNFYTFCSNLFCSQDIKFIVVSGKDPVHEAFYIMILAKNINSFTLKNSIFFKMHLWVTVHLWVTWVYSILRELDSPTLKIIIKSKNQLFLFPNFSHIL